MELLKIFLGLFFSFLITYVVYMYISKPIGVYMTIIPALYILKLYKYADFHYDD